MKVKVQRGLGSAALAAMVFTTNLHGQDLNSATTTNSTGIAR